MIKGVPVDNLPVDVQGTSFKNIPAELHILSEGDHGFDWELAMTMLLHGQTAWKLWLNLVEQAKIINLQSDNQDHLNSIVH